MFSVVFLAACAVYLVLDLQLIRGLRRLRIGSNSSGTRRVGTAPGDLETLPDVTVLVAARDEEANLPRTLDRLLAQEWPAEKLQIVVVDDRSADATPDILRDYVARFPGRLESVRVETVAPWLADRVLANTRNGVAIRWLTPFKLAGYFLLAPFRKRDVFGPAE